MKPYDPRLDSPDPLTRQQAEIEALRTALVALNSDSCGEMERLRSELRCMTDSYNGQKRNTTAFKRELDEARERIKQLEKPVEEPEVTYDDDQIELWWNDRKFTLVIRGSCLIGITSESGEKPWKIILPVGLLKIDTSVLAG